MCGRFSLTGHPARAPWIPETLRPYFERSVFRPRYNIAPTQRILALMNDLSGFKTCEFHWGFVPKWMQSESSGRLLINARMETIETRRTFQESIQSRRCLIPADGYFEWSGETSGKQRKPWYLTLPSSPLFFMAGIWNEMELKDGSKQNACVLLTHQASPAVRRIHHRMPWIVSENRIDDWLSDSLPSNWKLWAESNHGLEVDIRPVNPIVNSAKVDTPECIGPPPHQGDLFESGYDLLT